MSRRLRHRYGRAGSKSCKKVLEDLFEYATGNRGSREGNPYTKPEVLQAARYLKKIDW